MAQVTVFFLRCGETVLEAYETALADYEKSPPPTEENNEGEAPPAHEPPSEISPSQRADPPLTSAGYEQAQNALTCLLQALGQRSNEQRKMAAFSAPLKSCTATALMFSCALLPRHENLFWKLATVEAIKAPAAVPVLVVNGLCNGNPDLKKFGDTEAVINAGLLSCAAERFNDARNKCPFMSVVKSMRAITRKRVEAWKKAGREDRRVINVQYLRMSNPNDPWSMADLTPKVNILVDHAEPKKYLPPPRKGSFEPKLQKQPKKPGPEMAIRQAVWWARQCGCDTVFMVVPGSTMETVIREAGAAAPTLTPCSVASVLATVRDETMVSWKVHGVYSAEQLQNSAGQAIPSFPGPIDVLVKPPEGQDPSSMPPHQWSVFSPPTPENIPPGYPNLPPFSQSLLVPVPSILLKGNPHPHAQESHGVEAPKSLNHDAPASPDPVSSHAQTEDNVVLPAAE